MRHAHHEEASSCFSDSRAQASGNASHSRHHRQLCIISNEFAEGWNSYKIVAAVLQQFNKPPILTNGEENGWIIVGISPDKIRDAIAKIIDGHLPKWKLKLKLRTVRKIQMSRAVLKHYNARFRLG